MSGAIRKLHEYLAKSPSVVYPEDVLARLSAIEVENAKMRETATMLARARTDLLAENAKLRELVVLWSVINKHMSLCATTDCEQCPVREECGESVYLEGLLGIDPKGLSWRMQERMAGATDVQAENAKLRDLVLGMMICSDDSEEAQKCPLYDENEPYRCRKDRLMSELGLSKE